MANPKLKSEIENLRQDASKIVADISSLSRTMGAVGKDSTHDMMNEAQSRAAEELESLKDRMKILEEKSREYARAVDDHVKQNPYLYILGCLGLGVFMGKLLAPKAR